MEVAARINRVKYDVFRWRCELSIPNKFALAFGMACIIGAVAQIRVFLPWSPVPVTGQTFAVLLAGVLLGRWWGGASLAIYTGLGVAGVPWFAGLNGGLGYLAGPTGGYLIGFILAAIFLGYFTDTYIRSRSLLSMIALMLFANFILIYIPGLLHLGLWLNLVKGEPTAFTAVLGMGAAPFLIGDATKVVLAAVVAKGIAPKSNYNGDIDRGVD